MDENALRRANRSRIEEQLRKKRGPVSRRCHAGHSVEHFERGRLGDWWIRRQVEHRHALVVAKWIGHVRPVETMLCPPQGGDAVFRNFMIFAPRHRRFMDATYTRQMRGWLLDLSIEPHRACMPEWIVVTLENASRL